jgi:putative protease
MAKAKAKAKKKAKSKIKRKKLVARKKPTRKAVKRVLKKPAPKAKRAPKAKAAKPASPPPPPPPPGERIGVVTHYYGHLSVAVVKLEPGVTLRVGDNIHVKGHTSDFSQRVDSLQIGHEAVQEVGPNDDFGLKVVQHAREHDVVYRVKPS